ncbi:hypothetical protein P1J78_08980 [Psychromarinibacter sp. C21-152]|uniref:LPXTG-motif cell wall anchor domain-containing protein n=1 Tax=Psychromarinibacter sediminicola TaxID=3033385 RepID=A0AAE3T8M2_9RHOB|nr:DUF6732 family protein [Psychromarinibacter sediminicola]MDF0600863.1 hypothetical protein [Psychromarinibacter sediminicola]
MRIVFITATFAAGPALAHPGHLAEVAGHGHWIGLAALGAAIAVAAWAGLKGRKDADEEAESDEEVSEEETPQEA